MKTNRTVLFCVLVALSGCVATNTVATSSSGCEDQKGAKVVRCVVDKSGIVFPNDAVSSVSNMSFTVGEGETQSISGGSFYARPTMAGFVKAGAGTLVVDSPVDITKLGDVQAGTLKVAKLFSDGGGSAEEMLAPMPTFSALRFAPGTRLDLSDNPGFQLMNLVGAPTVVNSGVFGVTGKWTLTAPGEVLTVQGEGAALFGESYAGQLAFAAGAEFDFKDAAAEAAFSRAVAAAGSAGIVIARAKRVYAEGDALGDMPLVMPKPSAATDRRWLMRASDDRKSIRLFLQ